LIWLYLNDAVPLLCGVPSKFKIGERWTLVPHYCFFAMVSLPDVSCMSTYGLWQSKKSNSLLSNDDGTGYHICSFPFLVSRLID